MAILGRGAYWTLISNTTPLRIAFSERGLLI
jgi:hypothetical protein